MPRTNRAQLGCLILLLLWAAVGALFQFFGLWTHGGPGDDEGGGPFAALGLLGFIAFFLIFGTLAVARWIGNAVSRRDHGEPATTQATERQPDDA